MIDTKIACQCGTRFKFGFELAGGRAPTGLACPSCSAPMVGISATRSPAFRQAATRARKSLTVRETGTVVATGDALLLPGKCEFALRRNIAPEGLGVRGMEKI